MTFCVSERMNQMLEKRLQEKYEALEREKTEYLDKEKRKVLDTLIAQSKANTIALEGAIEEISKNRCIIS